MWKKYKQLAELTLRHKIPINILGHKYQKIRNKIQNNEYYAENNKASIQS